MVASLVQRFAVGEAAICSALSFGFLARAASIAAMSFGQWLANAGAAKATAITAVNKTLLII